MNVLILTGKFGMGHYSVSEAIKEQVSSKNVYIIDILNYMYPKRSKLMYKSFYFMVKYCSKIYNCLNNCVEKSPFVPYKHNYIEIMDSLIKEYDADIVVSTLPICSYFISKYKEKTGSDIKFYTYITDITIHEEWITPYTDLYFVGDESTKNFLLSHNIKSKNIVVSGIPVRKIFNKKYNKLSKQKEVLVMGGGLGVMPFINTFINNMRKNKNIHITIITGNNIKLKKKLIKKYPDINVLGFVENIDKYIKRADLIVTKSGGITTFEAIYSLTPLYIIKPFLMQEIGNANFINDRNLGLVQWDNELGEENKITEFLLNEKLQHTIKDNMLKIKSEMESIDMDSYYK